MKKDDAPRARLPRGCEDRTDGATLAEEAIVARHNQKHSANDFARRFGGGCQSQLECCLEQAVARLLEQHAIAAQSDFFDNVRLVQLNEVVGEWHSIRRRQQSAVTARRLPQH